MKRYAFLVTCLFCLSAAFGQLKTSIGLDALPKDSDPVCTITTHQGGYDNSGFKNGDTVADFKLYDVQGDAMQLSDELAKGKPVLLVGGSYTCPVFRNKVTEINKVVAAYSGQVSVWIVYVVEAHPVTDPSPYSGKEWVTGQNQQENILVRQPTTYGERKTVVSQMSAAMTFTPTILIDGPCNAWWKTFGPAPNNAYLIQPNGIVYAKHGWFDKSPNDIYCDIDRLLGKTCNQQSGGGNFIWKLDGSNTVAGAPGEILTVKGKLINNSAGAAQIEVMRMKNVTTTGWTSAMCVDICLQEWVDTTEFVLAAGDTQSYTMYFYSGASGNETGNVRIGFRNKENTNNKMAQDFYAQTWSLGIQDAAHASLFFYPNPATTALTFNANASGTVHIYDFTGRLHKVYAVFSGMNHLFVEDLAPGPYRLLYQTEGKSESATFIRR